MCECEHRWIHTHKRAEAQNPHTHTNCKPSSAHFPITLSLKFITPADRFAAKATWIHHWTAGFEWFFPFCGRLSLRWVERRRRAPCTLCPDIFSAAPFYCRPGSRREETHTDNFAGKYFAISQSLRLATMNRAKLELAEWRMRRSSPPRISLMMSAQREDVTCPPLFQRSALGSHFKRWHNFMSF